ncbi:MAG: diguanylate cyclase [Gallionella sp.]|nr:diguanylate cyclase [Gallionella sp.]
MKNKNPSEVARETLKLLSQRRLLPTPDNYANIYAEISGTTVVKNDGAEQVLRNMVEHLLQTDQAAATGLALKKMLTEEKWDQCFKEIEKVLPKNQKDDADDQTWPVLIRDLLRQLDLPHKGLTVTRKKEGVETVLARFSSRPEILFEKLSNLVRSWSESPVTASLVEEAPEVPEVPEALDVPDVAASISTITPTITPTATATATTTTPAIITDSLSKTDEHAAEMLSKLAELLAQTLESSASTQPELTDEVRKLTTQVREIKTHDQVTELAKQLRQFWLKVELRGGDKTRIQEGLVRLLRLLVENVGEMVEDEEWLHGQITTLHEIIGKPLDKRMIADAERSLREAIIKQSLLKKSLTDTKSTLKSLMTTFIDRLGTITTSTGDYHQKIELYSQKIAQSNNLNDLGSLLDDIMQDTRIIQASALHSHEELLDSRRQVESAEAKISKLEKELSEVSEMVQQDQLTGALNRRGLDAAFERESRRVDRSHDPLCVALLDIDNFKRLNDTMGHQVGDQALVHLCNVIKEALRPSDSVARYGGEEFVIILPDVGLAEAASTLERLQRELTKQFFMYENDRVLITFSAGVAQRAEEESQEEILGRADKAMYQAKHTGKNRVVIAK